VQLLGKNCYIAVSYEHGKGGVGSLLTSKWGACYLFIDNFFATQIIGGPKEPFVILL